MRISDWSSDVCSSDLPTLADVPVTLPEPYVNDQWSQPGGSPAKTMGNLALGASPARAWTVSIAGSTPQARLASAPVVVGGKLYVIDADARVIAFDAHSGAKLWQTPPTAAGSGRATFGGGGSVDRKRPLL